MPCESVHQIDQSKIEEKELLSKLLMRDCSAFEYLYNSYSGVLFNILCQMLKCVRSSEDLLQKIFLKVYKDIEHYDAGRGKLFTWLIKISRDEALEFLRSKHFNHNLKALESLDEMKDLPADPCTIQFHRMELTNSLHLLPPKERSIMMLATMGYTISQIGKIVNLPMETIKSKLRTSYRKLQSQ